ncbi:MAG: YdcH family protein [Rickettsiaceae bacterium]|nr:YdcH family protein [Rickettsiaceae bacterium]
MTYKPNTKFLLDELKSLEHEHNELKILIQEQSKALDEFTIHRFKKRKLLVKDKIQVIKSMIHPDIIA